MNEYRCGECGATYRGFPFDRFIEIVERHDAECIGGTRAAKDGEQE